MTLGHLKVGTVISDVEDGGEYTVAAITLTLDQSGVSASVKLTDGVGNATNLDAEHIQREAAAGFYQISSYTKAEVGIADVSLGELIAIHPGVVDAISHIALDNGGRVNHDYRLEYELLEVVAPVLNEMAKKKISGLLPDYPHPEDVECCEDNCLKAFCYGEASLMEDVQEVFDRRFHGAASIASDFLCAVFEGEHSGAIQYGPVSYEDAHPGS